MSKLPSPAQAYLMVPVHLDALVVETPGEKQNRVIPPTWSVRSLAEFSRLPFVGRDSAGNARDVDAETTYLSESIVAHPGSDLRVLEPGIHLHWALPRALTTAIRPEIHDKPHGNPHQKLDFVPVPNRWIVTRWRQNKLEKKWLVESDYVWPEGTNPAPDRSSYLHQDPTHSGEPYRFVGKKHALDLTATWQESQSGPHLPKLTAVGYGEPTFAAFYPNCRNIFGMCDDETTDGADGGLTYEVFGFYGGSGMSVRQLVELGGPTDGPWSGDAKETAAQSMARNLGWASPPGLTRVAGDGGPTVDDDTEVLDRQLLFYSRLSFRESTRGTPTPPFRDAGMEVSIGNSESEALSALIANKLALNVPFEAREHKRTMIEDQLESLRFGGKLQRQRVDLGAKFQEARHSSSFARISSGIQWIVRPQPPSQASATPDAASTGDGAPLLILPSDFAATLELVNRLQRNWDEGRSRLESRQEQIFADWCKYLTSAYPADDRRGDYPDLHLCGKHLENQVTLQRLQEAHLGPPLLLDQDGSRGLPKEPDADDVRAWAARNTDHLVAGYENELAEWIEQVRQAAKSKRALPLSISGQLARGLRKLQSSLDRHAQAIDEAKRLAKQFDQPVDPADSSQNVRQIVAVSKALEQLRRTIPEIPPLPPSVVFASGSAAGATSAQIASAANDVIIFLRRLAGAPELVLQESPAAPYWQPAEPCIVLFGDAVTDDDRHDVTHRRWHPEGLLPCRLSPVGALPGLMEADAKVLKALHDDLDAVVKSGQADDHPAFHVGESHPWRPIFLEWSVEVESVAVGGNLDSATRRYSPTYLTLNQSWDELRQPFLKFADRISGVRTGQEMTGRSIITARAPQRLATAIDDYLVGKLAEYLRERAGGVKPPLSDDENKLLAENLADAGGRAAWLARLSWMLDQGATPSVNARDGLLQWCDLKHGEVLVANYLSAPSLDVDSEDLSPEEVLRRQLVAADANLPRSEFLVKHQQAILDWFKRPGSDANVELRSVARNLVEARQLIKADGARMQAQSLSGFNAALLQRRQTFQLDVADPMNFEEFRRFTDEVVRPAVGAFNRSAPVPHSTFQPIRSGRFQFTKGFRLVGNFGTLVKINASEATPSLPLSNTGASVNEERRAADGKLYLPTRITQPARLNFHWLAANDLAAEANAHPDSSPICGWFLPNLLDGSVMVYDQAGSSLGSIVQTGHWSVAPGGNGLPSPAMISNAHLAKTVAWILDRPDDLEQFLGQLEMALESIDPENYADHSARALVMGRPTALVRASVSMDLKGLPAINQSWDSYIRHLAGQRANTDGFTSIRFPVRVGASRQLNDGVVGLWVEDATGTLAETFHPRGAFDEHRQGDAAPFSLAADSSEVRLSLLMDPRGLVHCVTGILPTAAISLNAEYYRRSLNAIEVTFLTAPVLTTAQTVEIPLPLEPGFTWSWIENDRQQWKRVTTTPVVSSLALADAFDDSSEIWERLIAGGWIDPIANRPGYATIRRADRRKAPDLAIPGSRPLSVKPEEIERALYASASVLNRSPEEARFGPDYDIREGWLALHPETDTSFF